MTIKFSYKKLLGVLILAAIILFMIACTQNASENQNQPEEKTGFFSLLKAKEIFGGQNDFKDLSEIQSISYREIISGPNYNQQLRVSYKNEQIIRSIEIFRQEYELKIDLENEKYTIIHQGEAKYEINPSLLREFEKETLIDKIEKIRNSEYQQVGYRKIGQKEIKVYEFIDQGIKHKFWIDQDQKIPFKIEVLYPDYPLTFDYQDIKINQ